MIEFDNNITGINIKNTEEFIVENIIKYQNLTSLLLDNIIIDNFSIINQLFDNLNLYKIKLLNCNFYIEKMKIKIKLADNKFMFYLSNVNLSKIKDILINLPQCIDHLYIEQCVGSYERNPMLNDSFVNLSPLLQYVEINFLPSLPNYTIKTLEIYGLLNCLFDAKIPFGCELIIKISYLNSELKYKVIYEHNLVDELTLNLQSKDKNNDNIKKLEYKIKKVYSLYWIYL
jgi:hypothetical protein